MEIVFHDSNPFGELGTHVERFISHPHSQIIGIYEKISPSLWEILKTRSFQCLIGIHISHLEPVHSFVFDALILRDDEDFERVSKFFPSSHIRVCPSLDTTVFACFFSSFPHRNKFYSYFSASLGDIHKAYLLSQYFDNPGAFSKLCPSLDINTYIDRPLRFQLSFFSQNNFSSLRTYGWDFVVSSLGRVSSPFGRIWLDTFLEKTFISDLGVMIRAGIVPYTVPWVGIAHHTFDRDYNQFGSAENIFNEEFHASLPYCKGIVCLSQYLAQEYQRRLPHIPIISLPHPVDLTMEKWKGWDQSVVTVGNWYRNPFSLCLLSYQGKKEYLVKSTAPFIVKEKADNALIRFALEHLRGLHFPIGSFHHFDLRHPRDPAQRILCRELHRYMDNITISNYLESSEYRQKLSSAVVFLNLVDCSASYTVMECIATSTPLLINRHPAVEEYLGIDYPLYYDDPESFDLTEEKVSEAHRYLLKMDKIRFSMDYFCRELERNFLQG